MKNIQYQANIVYLKVKWPYIAVKLDCLARQNIGAIERNHQGGGFPGTLNVKTDFDRLMGGRFASDPRFNPANPLGQLRRGAGTAYIGWIDFGTIAKAIAFLRLHFNVIDCSVGGHIEDSSGAYTPIPEIGGSNYWDTLKGVLERAPAKNRPKKIVLRGGGSVSVPDWFKRWCAEKGIEIEIYDMSAYDGRFRMSQYWAEEHENS